LIKAEGLRKSYGSHVAVAGVTLSIGKGEIFGLLGPNGAGKSTTILMLVGALRPDSGSISIAGAGSPTEASVRKRIGLAPQALAIYEELTGQENLDFYGSLYGLTAAAKKERVDWALELAGLTDRRKDLVRTYSGGMKRRLNIACALVHEPEIVFLDEPTVGVDPQSRNYIFESVQRLQKEGLTVIYTTHYMEEAQRLCDRVAIMDHGNLLALDTVEGLVNTYGGGSVVTAELDHPEALNGDLTGELIEDEWRTTTDKPFEVVSQLAKAPVGMRSLRVDRPDLETVFLALTGRSLRD